MANTTQKAGIENTATEVTETQSTGTEVSENQLATLDNDQTELVSHDYVDASAISPQIFEKQNEVFFSSIQATDRASQIKMYNAINGSEAALSDEIGSILNITDMVAHAITLEDEVTKQPVNALRVVLVDDQGKGYHAISEGIVSSLQKIIAVVGQAPWTPALQVTPVQVKTRKGFKTLTLKLVD